MELRLERALIRGELSRKQRYTVLAMYAVALLSACNAVYFYRFGRGWRAAALSLLMAGVLGLVGRVYHVEVRSQANARAGELYRAWQEGEARRVAEAETLLAAEKRRVQRRARARKRA